MRLHGLILAGGDGSRLAAEGMRDPKPLVKVAGRPQLLRLIDALLAAGCPDILCMVREGLPGVRESVRAAYPGERIRTVPCHTPSSLHTLVSGLALMAPGPVLCAMVDTVMRGDDWQRAAREVSHHLEDGADAVLVVTPFIQDESPLYVKRDARGYACQVASGQFPASPRCVSGGVYGFSSAARRAAADAAAQGVFRMRGFLQELLEQGARVPLVEVGRIVDLDRMADLRVAEAWLA